MFLTEPAILLIDDDPSVIDIITRYLNYLAPTIPVFSAETGAIALTTLKTHPITLAFVDYHLPDIKGTQLIPTIQCHSPNTTIILCTGAILPQPEVDRLGVSAILSKPFTLVQLDTIIHGALIDRNKPMAKAG